MMMSSQVMVATRSKYYGSKRPIEDGDDSNSLGQTSTSTPPTSEPLHIEKLNHSMVIRPRPKSVLRKSSFNPLARATQNYNIVEDLAMSPLVMSTLEVLHTCPTQRQLLLSVIGAIDLQYTNLIVFYLENHVPQLPHQLAFQIPVHVKTRQVFRTVIDEGESTCIMSIACWKALGSPTINQSPTTLKAFDGRGFHPFGILNHLPIGIEGKTVIVEVEVVDAELDYNILLGQS